MGLKISMPFLGVIDVNQLLKYRINSIEHIIPISRYNPEFVTREFNITKYNDFDKLIYPCPKCGVNEIVEYFKEDDVYDCMGNKINSYNPRICDWCYNKLLKEEAPEYLAELRRKKQIRINYWDIAIFMDWMFNENANFLEITRPHRIKYVSLK